MLIMNDQNNNHQAATTSFVRSLPHRKDITTDTEADNDYTDINGIGTRGSGPIHFHDNHDERLGDEGDKGME